MKTIGPIPFDNSSFDIEELNIESSEDHISINGYLSISRDENGLAQTQKLLDYFQMLENQLNSDKRKGLLPKNLRIEKPILKDNPML